MCIHNNYETIELARVQLIIGEEKRSRYIHQAHKEGLTLSAWMRAAADERLERNSRYQLFESAEDIEKFFNECDELETKGQEPDWEQHRSVMDEVRKRGAAST